MPTLPSIQEGEEEDENESESEAEASEPPALTIPGLKAKDDDGVSSAGSAEVGETVFERSSLRGGDSDARSGRLNSSPVTPGCSDSGDGLTAPVLLMGHVGAVWWEEPPATACKFGEGVAPCNEAKWALGALVADCTFSIG